MDQLEGAQSDVKPQSTTSLEGRSLTPGALVCVPEEPVLVLPLVVDAELLSFRDEGPMPVEEQIRDSSC